ncbi:CidA/LrgA family protein [Colwellia sp. 20A7]|jgi:holin-like protein|uniref:CidA/LrgA family protein n=1 Tax=Colwellia sp. 20A7 TaxID=2689569 RepID=UPI001357FDF7|nr:CidA/LrgA family protein [Colwellia sp. 20A7]
MKNIIYTIIAISICLISGRMLYSVIGGLPASLYGMIMYCLLLQLGWFNPDKVQQANQWGIKHMGICFIPAAVGVINHFELFQRHGYSIVAIILVTTFILITFVGILAEKYLTKKSKPAVDAKDY